MNPVFLLTLFIVFLNTLMAFNDGEDVEIENDDSFAGETNLKKKYGQQIDNVLQPFIKKLKDNQEIVISSGTAFSGDSRFKSGDVHIRKVPVYVKFKNQLIVFKLCFILLTSHLVP
jgi:hypothetical protein